MLRELGEPIIKRKNISPSRGREIAAAEVAEAAQDREAAAAEKSAAERDRAQAAQSLQKVAQELKDAKASRETANRNRRIAEEERAAVAAQAESLQIGTTAILAEELAYAPPSGEAAERLTWGRNKPESQERRAWLAEKIKPAKEWLIGFARSVFGSQQRIAAVREEQKTRAQAIVDAEAKMGRRPPETMIDVARDNGRSGFDPSLIPGAWAVPKDMKAQQIDEHLRSMTNTAIYDAYAPTRDAGDFSEHAEIQARYRSGLHHLAKEAERRGLDVELGEHHPDKATDVDRAKLHTDLAPVAINVRRRDRDRAVIRGS
ncbi:MAG: hypothetical protein WA989_09270 [Henriciella sp.]|uniref:hypothetical protein n=1 Tax=Henriciella sp. TaxID=1968823 RepID=UPI003C74C2B6